MAISGSNFSLRMQLLAPLLLVAGVSIVFSQQQQQQQQVGNWTTKLEQHHSDTRQDDTRLLSRLRRGLDDVIDIIPDILNVGQSRRGSGQRRSSRQSENAGDRQFGIGIGGLCPREPQNDSPANMRVRMRFHRVGDQFEDELRLDESPNRKSWQTSALDEMVRERGFDLNKPTLVYMGGWLQDLKSNHLEQTRKNYNELYRDYEPAYNLLFFDWRDYGQITSYGTSVSYVPLLARKLASFFLKLNKRHGYDLSKLHLIPYSLSSHFAALAGRHLKAKGHQVGQITFLDPTGVCFHDDTQWARRFAARPTDAKLTVAKHFNFGSLGSRRYMGGVDIIVNDGKVHPERRNWADDIARAFSPRGLRGHLLAADHESKQFNWLADCHYMAYKCKDLQSFEAGECGSCGNYNETCYLVSTAGNHILYRDLTQTPFAKNSKMYIKTGNNMACAHHYQVIARLNKEPPASVASGFEKGKFAFEVDDNVLIKPANKLNDKTFTQLLVLNRLIEFDTQTIDAKKLAKYLDYIESVDIKYLSNVRPQARATNSHKYCPERRSNTLVSCR